jgi:hypothetical protein
MGITAGPSYTTDEGFVISPLYLSVNSMRFTVTADGDLHCVYTVKGYKSRADKKAGRNAINLPQNLSLMDTFVGSSVLATQNMYTVTYLAIKRTWGLAGFQVEDVHEPGQAGYVDTVAEAVLVASEADAAAVAARAAATAAHAIEVADAAAAATADALAAANPSNVAAHDAAAAADAVAAAAEVVAAAAEVAAETAEAEAVAADVIAADAVAEAEVQAAEDEAATL